jgi:hypothetical protein
VLGVDGVLGIVGSDGGVVGVPGVGIEGSDGVVGDVGMDVLSVGIVVVLALSVALPLIERVLVSEAVALVLASVSELCVLAQAAENTSVEATARP